MSSRLIINTSRKPYDSLLEFEGFADDFDYTTYYTCVGWLYLPFRGSIINITSTSASNAFDDTTFYDDINGIAYAFKPELIIDVHREDVETDSDCEGPNYFRIEQGKLIIPNV